MPSQSIGCMLPFWLGHVDRRTENINIPRRQNEIQTLYGNVNRIQCTNYNDTHSHTGHRAAWPFGPPRGATPLVSPAPCATRDAQYINCGVTIAHAHTTHLIHAPLASWTGYCSEELRTMCRCGAQARRSDGCSEAPAPVRLDHRSSDPRFEIVGAEAAALARHTVADGAEGSGRFHEQFRHRRRLDHGESRGRCRVRCRALQPVVDQMPRGAGSDQSGARRPARHHRLRQARAWDAAPMVGVGMQLPGEVSDMRGGRPPEAIRRETWQ